MPLLNLDETLAVLTRFAQGLGVPLDFAPDEDCEHLPYSWGALAEHNHCSLTTLFSMFQEVARDCGWLLTPGGPWNEEHTRIIVNWPRSGFPHAGEFMIRGRGMHGAYGPRLELLPEAKDALQNS